MHASDCESAIRILANYSVNPDESVEFFRDSGGFCDWEILMNVDPGFVTLLLLLTSRRKAGSRQANRAGLTRTNNHQ
jgi:hypothetical protein